MYREVYFSSLHQNPTVVYAAYVRMSVIHPYAVIARVTYNRETGPTGSEKDTSKGQNDWGFRVVDSGVDYC